MKYQDRTPVTKNQHNESIDSGYNSIDACPISGYSSTLARGGSLTDNHVHWADLNDSQPDPIGGSKWFPPNCSHVHVHIHLHHTHVHQPAASNGQTSDNRESAADSFVIADLDPQRVKLLETAAENSLRESILSVVRLIPRFSSGSNGEMISPSIPGQASLPSPVAPSDSAGSSSHPAVREARTDSDEVNFSLDIQECASSEAPTSKNLQQFLERNGSLDEKGNEADEEDLGSDEEGFFALSFDGLEEDLESPGNREVPGLQRTQEKTRSTSVTPVLADWVFSDDDVDQAPAAAESFPSGRASTAFLSSEKRNQKELVCQASLAAALAAGEPADSNAPPMKGPHDLGLGGIRITQLATAPETTQGDPQSPAQPLENMTRRKQALRKRGGMMAITPPLSSRSAIRQPLPPLQSQKIGPRPAMNGGDYSMKESSLKLMKSQHSFPDQSEAPHSAIQTTQDFKINIVKLEAGLDQRTTVMVRHIPNKYTQRDFLKALHPFRNSFDFLYIPLDFKNKTKHYNVGYAFVNFSSCKMVIPFYREFHHKKWDVYKSEKICEVTFARLQGKIELLHHFALSSVMHQDRKLRPIFKLDLTRPEDQMLLHHFPHLIHLENSSMTADDHPALDDADRAEQSLQRAKALQPAADSVDTPCSPSALLEKQISAPAKTVNTLPQPMLSRILQSLRQDGGAMMGLPNRTHSPPAVPTAPATNPYVYPLPVSPDSIHGVTISAGQPGVPAMLHFNGMPPMTANEKDSLIQLLQRDPNLVQSLLASLDPFGVSQDRESSQSPPGGML